MLDLLPELCDHYPQHVRLFPPIFKRFGGRNIFGGEVVTIRCFEDNSLVRTAVAEPGLGKVLLIDGGGMSRRALLGDMLAQKAVDNGWSGIVVFGYIRDVNAIAAMDIGVMALGAVPMKTDKRGLGDRDIEVNIGGCVVHPGDSLYADANGVLVADEPLSIAQQEIK
ncbi:putative 4-hydroxy-4-methyl-2-oxoglutarate aldolase [Ferrimonas lipolytica]|uniref:4-hydroxy-4-methyl-2-oxoglutarate aldolase n=1 Tax=Ferrimonas lipolytica TaxID=2724191 RepID=A0A6H1UE23_9GAMM|nr:putative 4-hydroxy-4-methyl-2-oxoglutarate aldolase [Ferrimonas lipolytica]QIZ76840.1 putative 4-hydroxy-4-methyl-2-oxoglutarate aldolase [Ferrimonas lipolytica]